MKIVTVLGKVQDRIHNIKIFGSLNFDCVIYHEIVNGEIAKTSYRSSVKIWVFHIIFLIL